jgi:hypothetical protein
MGFSSQQYKKEQQVKKYAVHPVWRGIGCILLLLVPIMSWYIAGLFLESNKKIALPYIFSQVLTIPRTHIAELDRLIIPINHYLTSTHFMFGQVFLMVIFSFIGFGILAFIYAIIYKMAGPSRYGPFDWPPNKL